MLRLTWLGHSSVVIDIDGVRLLTDPLLRRNAGLLRRVGPTPSPQAWGSPDGVLISHLHHDHAELASLQMVAGAPVLTGPRNARWLAGKLGADTPDLADGTWAAVRGRAAEQVQVRLVRADHGARPMPHRPNEAHGHLVRSEHTVVWFAGDTSVYPELAELPELAGRPIDVALLPIAGWGPRLSAGHMDAAQAVQACRVVRPRAVMAIHHGTLHPPVVPRGASDWMHRPMREFRHQLAEACPDVRLLDVPLGGSVEVPPA